MFDDQPIKTTGSVPGNLPIAEPEDMFDGVEKDDVAVEETPAPVRPLPPTPNYQSRPSAIDAGILKAKPLPESVGLPPENAMPQPDMYTLKGPVVSRGIITVIILVVVVGILGTGGWWIYSSFIRPNNNNFDSGTNTVTPSATTDESTANTNAPVANQPVTQPPTDINRETVDNSLLFGEPLDLDEDQLDDELEKSIGTDSNNWDTDGDGLGDGEEVLIWKSDPLNPDTDGDSFADGSEVANGYSPTGPGRILTPPTTTSTL